MESVKVYVPASTGNIGPGFDVLGMAIDYSGDIVQAKKTKEPGVFIESIEGNPTLSKEPEKNTAGIAAMEVMKKLNINSGVIIKLQKKLPLGSGLGSSAASAVGAGFAVASLYAPETDKHELIEPITRAEEAVSSSFFL